MENNELYGLVLNKGEREELYKLCIEYKIPILYPRLFKSDEPHHYLWGFNKDGIALVGTIIMRRLTKNRRVLHGIKELESFLKNNQSYLPIGNSIEELIFFPINELPRFFRPHISKSRGFPRNF